MMITKSWFALMALASTTLFAADGEGVHSTGFRLPPNPRRTASSQTAQGTTKRTLLKSSTQATLPSRWDSRDNGWVTPIRSQGSVDTCWAFAAIATLETQLLKSGRGEHNLSEKNMATLHGFENKCTDGGDFHMAEAYLLRWGGAVAETNDIYKSTAAQFIAYPSKEMIPAIHVQNVVWVPGRRNTSDNDTLKNAIMKYGAVSVAMCWDPSYAVTNTIGSYYCKTAGTLNHAVAVIGWDDNYSKSNFSPRDPENNGAWIVKNSHGVTSGSNGFYHVSYYDNSFAMGYDGFVFIPASSNENYTAVYGYDRLGYIGPSDEFVSYDSEAAVFTSAWNEKIAAVGVYSLSTSIDYEICVYTNVNRSESLTLSGEKRAAKQTGKLTNMGYTTIPLEKPVDITDRSHFAVTYRQKGQSSYKHALNYTDNYEPDIYYPEGKPYSKCEHKAGNTYIGSSASGEWVDAYRLYASPCVCLKAYTISTVIANDGPDEDENGKSMRDSTKINYNDICTEMGETFGAFANIVGANGRTLWASWLAGFDPSRKDDNKLVVDIAVTNNVPYLSWKPDLGSIRKYSIFGTKTPCDTESWQEVENQKPTDARFFKVTVGQ